MRYFFSGEVPPGKSTITVRDESIEVEKAAVSASADLTFNGKPVKAGIDSVLDSIGMDLPSGPINIDNPGDRPAILKIHWIGHPVKEKTRTLDHEMDEAAEKLRDAKKAPATEEVKKTKKKDADPPVDPPAA